ncbi:MAG TPA: hypothetical protein VK986_10655 [Tepidisphaeraceae bacterium]|nr:hypothetical protein [Tepidisphaeraceae bacterium]
MAIESGTVKVLPRVRRRSRLAGLLLAAVCATGFVSPARAADAPPPPARARAFAAGDKVEAKRLGKWVPATVVRFENGRYRVTFEDKFPGFLKPEDVREPGAAAAVPAAPAAPVAPAVPGPPAVAGPKTFKVGDAVEAKVGDSWFPGTVVTIAPTKTQVKYEDGTSGWVATADEVRPRAAAPAAVAGAFKAGDLVEAMWGGTWWSAKVTGTANGEIQVVYDDGITKSLKPHEVRNRGTAAAAVPAGKPGRPAAAELTTPAPAPESVAAVNFAGVREVKLDAVAYAVKHDPEPAPAAPARALADRPVPLNVPKRATTFGDRPERILFTDRTTAQAIVAFHESSRFKDPERGRYRRVDLATGAALELVELEPWRKLIDISPDGKRGVARVRVLGPKDRPSPFDNATNSYVQLLDMTGGKCTPGVTFRPCGAEAELSHVAFVDNAHLITQSRDNLLVYWELKPEAGAVPRPVYRLKADHGSRPSLSPGGKYYAVVDGGEIRFVETATGNPLGTLPELKLTSGGHIAFKADGIVAAVTDRNRVLIVHVPTGRTMKTIPLPPSYAIAQGLEWVDGGHVLLGNRYLINVNKRLAVWSYNLGVGVSGVFGGRGYSLHGRDAKLVSAVIPHEQALAVQTEANPDNLLIFRPGVKVGLDLNTDAPEDVRAKIAKSFEEQIKAMGAVVAPDGALRVVVSSETGPAKEMEFRSFMGGGGIQKVSVSDKIHKVTVTLDGQEVWKTQSTAGVSMFLTLKKDQSIQDAIAEQQNRSYTWIPGMRLPTTLIRESDYPQPGSSTLTEEGTLR